MPTGRRYSLYYCIVLAPGHHISHNLHCSLNFDTEPSAPLSSTNSAPRPSVHSTSLSQPFNNASMSTTMPKCHRMCCRRSIGQGRVSRPPLSNRSESSSPSLEDSYRHYPATRSGRDHDLALRRSCSLTHVRISSPSLNHPTSQSSLLLPHLETLPSPSTTHSTQFHYTCTLDHPCITATIFISFKEEASNADSLHPRKFLIKSTSDSMPLPPTRNPEALPTVHGAAASSSKSKRSTGNGSSGTDNSSKDWFGDDGGMGSARTANIPVHAAPQDTNVDDTEEYRCVIVKETPRPGNYT